MKGILPSNIKAMEDPDLLQDEDLDSLVLRYNTFIIIIILYLQPV